MNGRVPPTGDAEAIRRYLRMQEEETARRLSRLEGRAPERAEVTVLSLGSDEEIRVPHDWPRVPNRFVELCPRSSERVYQSRQDVGDANFLYLKSTGPEGTKHTIEYWRQ